MAKEDRDGASTKKQKAWSRVVHRATENKKLALDTSPVYPGQALRAAYATTGVEVITRYEVHLDRTLERTLVMPVLSRI